MGVGFGPRSKMRGFVLLSLAFLLSSFFIGPMEGAKGGAKSAMNRRGKGKDSGRRGQGAGREDDDEDIGGQGDKSVPYAKRPRVGLCYILKMKAKGIKKLPRTPWQEPKWSLGDTLGTILGEKAPGRETKKQFLELGPSQSNWKPR